MLAEKKKFNYLNPLYFLNIVIRALVKSKGARVSHSDIGLFFYPYINLFLSIFVILLIPFSSDFCVFDNLSDYALFVVYIYILLRLILPIMIYGIFPRNYGYNFVSTYTYLTKIISFSVCYLLALLPIIILTKDTNIYNIIESQHKYINIYSQFPVFVILIFSIISLRRRYYTSHSVDFVDNSYGLRRLVGRLGYNLEFFIYSIAIIYMFFGGWKPIFNTDIISSEIWLIIKSLILYFLIILIRKNTIETNSERIMSLTFKIFVPFLCLWSLFVLIIEFMRG